jgi:hypothetical protein
MPHASLNLLTMKNNYFQMLNQFTQPLQELPGADAMPLDDEVAPKDEV